jgi:hypothetical protein
VFFCYLALKAYRRTKISKANSAASISQLDKLSAVPSNETAAEASRWTDIETQKLMRIVDEDSKSSDWASIATKLGTGRSSRSVETKWYRTRACKNQEQYQHQEKQKRKLLMEVDATGEKQESPVPQQFMPKCLGKPDGVVHFTDSHFGSWFASLNVGDEVQAKDQGKWYPAKIVGFPLGRGKVKVHYKGWNSRTDKWLASTPSSIQPVSGDKHRNKQSHELAEQQQDPPAEYDHSSRNMLDSAPLASLAETIGRRRRKPISWFDPNAKGQKQQLANKSAKRRKVVYNDQQQRQQTTGAVHHAMLQHAPSLSPGQERNMT